MTRAPPVKAAGSEVAGAAGDVGPAVLGSQGSSLDAPRMVAFRACGVARREVPKRRCLPGAVPGPIVGVMHVWEFESSPGWCTAVFKHLEGKVEGVTFVQVNVFAGDVSAFGYDDGLGD